MNNKDHELILAFILGFIVFGVGSLFIKNNNIPKQLIEQPKTTKQHKFHYDDNVIIIDGFNKGASGKIIAYYENSDKYQVYLNDHIMSSCLVNENEIKFKNIEDELIDFFSTMTDEELIKIANRKPEAVIGLSGVTMEKVKREDAKAAKEELRRRNVKVE